MLWKAILLSLSNTLALLTHCLLSFLFPAYVQSRNSSVHKVDCAGFCSCPRTVIFAVYNHFKTLSDKALHYGFSVSKKKSKTAALAGDC